MSINSLAKTVVKDIMLGKWLPGVYARAAEKAPIDPRKALFVAQKGHDMPDNFQLVFARLHDVYGFDTRFVTLRYDEVSYPDYLRNCAALLREAATARFVFLDDASDIMSCVNLRPGTDVVQLWHACGAFKKFGLSTAEKRFGGSRADKLRHPFYANLSLVTVSSPEVKWAYREAMSLDAQALASTGGIAGDAPERQVVQALGVSRTDVFFSRSYLNAVREEMQRLLPQIARKKVILYAPTFRGTSAQAKAPNQLDIAAMKRALGANHVLLVKHHPFVKELPPIPEGCEDFAFMAGAFPIEWLLVVADVCISDYSSLVYEYSLFGRPMVFFAYDKSDYDDWRGFYYDYDELTPGPVLTTTEQIVDYLVHIDERFDAAEVAAFRDKFMGACDGHATERICAHLLDRK